MRHWSCRDLVWSFQSGSSSRNSSSSSNSGVFLRPPDIWRSCQKQWMLLRNFPTECLFCPKYLWNEKECLDRWITNWTARQRSRFSFCANEDVPELHVLVDIRMARHWCFISIRFAGPRSWLSDTNWPNRSASKSPKGSFPNHVQSCTSYSTDFSKVPSSFFCLTSKQISVKKRELYGTQPGLNSFVMGTKYAMPPSN